MTRQRTAHAWLLCFSLLACTPGDDVEVVVQAGVVGPDLVVDPDPLVTKRSGPSRVQCGTKNVGSASATGKFWTIFYVYQNGAYVAGGGASLGYPMTLAPGQTVTLSYDFNNPYQMLANLDGYQLVCYVNPPNGYLSIAEIDSSNNKLIFQKETCSPNDVDCFLNNNPNVAAQVKWQAIDAATKTRLSVPWASWTAAQKNDLRQNFQNYRALLLGQIVADPLPMVDPPVNQAVLANGDYPQTYLGAADAWTVYMKHVAMSLAVEVQGVVPWSVSTYDADSLATLFDAARMMTYMWPGYPAWNTHEGYSVVMNMYTPSAVGSTFSASSWSAVTPGSPVKSLQFIQAQNLIGASRLETIARTVRWANRIRHLLGPSTAQNYENNWQYRGGAPVSRMIDGTTPAGGAYPLHISQGCTGTAAFLNAVLRTINIPTDVTATQTGHSAVRFMAEDLFLTHGDSPYGMDASGLPTPALGEELLVTRAELTAWLVSPPVATATNNVVRSEGEAMVDHLTGQVLYSYCKDLENNGWSPAYNHASSLILKLAPLSASYSTVTLAELEARTLWQRLADKVSLLGGPGGTPATQCANVIAALEAQKLQCQTLPFGEARCGYIPTYVP